MQNDFHEWYNGYHNEQIRKALGQPESLFNNSTVNANPFPSPPLTLKTITDLVIQMKAMELKEKDFDNYDFKSCIICKCELGGYIPMFPDILKNKGGMGKVLICKDCWEAVKDKEPFKSIKSVEEL